MPYTLVETFTVAGQSANARGIQRGDGRYIATYVAAVLAKDHVQIRMCLTKDRYDCKVAAETAIPPIESRRQVRH